MTPAAHFKVNIENIFINNLDEKETTNNCPLGWKAELYLVNNSYSELPNRL